MPKCFFAYDDDRGEPTGGFFLVATQEFWLEYHFLDDSHIAREVRLPEGFVEVQESLFNFPGTPAEGKAALVQAGHEENLDLLP